MVLAKNTTLFKTFPSLAMITKCKVMKNFGQYLCNMCLVICVSRLLIAIVHGY